MVQQGRDRDQTPAPWGSAAAECVHRLALQHPEHSSAMDTAAPASPPTPRALAHPQFKEPWVPSDKALEPDNSSGESLEERYRGVRCEPR